MYNKKVNGECPYCACTEFTESTMRRPFQKVQKCLNDDCEKFSVLNTRNNARYPLRDPLDQSSEPQV